jgi:hypothetical protein
MDELISRQHTLLVVAQENQLKNDQHQLVENDPNIPSTHIYDFNLQRELDFKNGYSNFQDKDTYLNL